MPKRKEKIVLFLASLRGGGAERMMMNLARGFAERGVKVDMVLAKAEGPYLDDMSPKVRVVDLGAKRVLYSLPGLVNYLRKEQPEAMLSAMSHANIVALWAKRLAKVRVKVVVSEHSTLSRSATNSPNLRGRFMPMLIKRFYPWADAVVAVSQGVADDLIEAAGLRKEKIRVIYNPVITSGIFTKAEESLDHPWFGAGEPPVVLGVGRLTKAKDFPTLIRAFALVRRERAVRLMIVGEGEERPKLESLVKELGLEKDVAMPGFVNNPYKYMKRAALFVLSSRWEGLPTVLIEALALGTLVVSTDCPSGPREILKNGKLGKLVPVGNLEALASAITGTLAENTRQTTSYHAYTLNTAVKRYLEVLGVS